MSLDYDSLSDKIDKHFSDPKNIESARIYFKKIEDKDNMIAAQVDRLWLKIKNNIDLFIESVISKYDSKKYNDNWYNRGIEPQEMLYWYIYDIAVKYGREFTKYEYEQLSMEDSYFTDKVYVLGSYKIESIHGQGSAVIINKYTPEKTKILFDTQSLKFIIEVLGKAVNSDGYVIELNGNYVLNKDGKKFKLENIISIDKNNFITND